MAYISFMECIYLNPLLKPQIFHRWPRLKGDFPGSSDQWLVEAKMGPHTSQHPMLRGPQVLALFFAQIWLGTAMKTSWKYGGTYLFQKINACSDLRVIATAFHLRITETCSNLFHSNFIQSVPGQAPLQQSINTSTPLATDHHCRFFCSLVAGVF